MPIVDLPASVYCSELGQDLPVYMSEYDTPEDWSGVFATPVENTYSEGWTEPVGGTNYGPGVGRVKSLYKSSPSVQVIRTPHPSLQYPGYDAAYRTETGQKYPGIGPLFAVVVAIIVIAIVFVAFIYNWRQVQMYAIDKSTEVSQEPLEGDPTNCWSLVCKGNTCQYFNTCTGETKTGPEGEDPWSQTTQYGDTVSQLIKYGGIVLIAGVGLYIGMKLVGSYQRDRRARADDDWRRQRERERETK